MFACGFEGGHYYQFAEFSGGPSASDWSLVTPVSPESGVEQGTYALFHQNAGGGMRRSFNPATIGAVGFMWRPETVPIISGGVSAHIVGLDSGSLGGFALGWDDDDKLNICSQSTPTVFKTGTKTYVPDGTPADTKNYYIWMMAINAPAGAIYMAWVHDFTAGVVNTAPLEVIYASEANGDFPDTTDETVDDIRLGQTAGNSTAGWYIDNIVVTKVANVSPALAPSFVATSDKTLGAIATDNANWVQGDGGGAGEETYIEDIPVDHSSTAQYLKNISTLFTFDFQSFTTEDGLAAGENVLGAAAWAEQYATTADFFLFQYVGWQTSGGVGEIGVAAATLNANAWEYTAFFANEQDPGNVDWTPALLDSAKLAHQTLVFGSGKESRISGLFAEIVYGPDNRYEFIVNESGYAITVVASAFIPKVIIY